MRKELLDLIDKTIIHEFDLPDRGINRSACSTENDECYSSSSNFSLSEVIYNSIIDYSFNEFELTEQDYNELIAIALKTKLKYNEKASDTSKISYGFHGETLLYCILCSKYDVNPVISRGYFYNPLESSETKGYDSYHLIEKSGKTELWFGEVKFRNTFHSGINEVLNNLERVISNDYLSTNFLAIYNHKNNLNISGSKVEAILNEWKGNPTVKIFNFIKKHNVKLVYPIFLLYDMSNSGYEKSINNAIKYIEKKFVSKKLTLGIPFSIYFIFMPVGKVNDIKHQVVEWIDSKHLLKL